MLEKLYDLQTQDLELDTLEEEKKQTPTELIEKQKEQEGLLLILEEKQQLQNDVKKQVKQNELELDTLEERRKSASSSALSANTPKEASQYRNQELQFATRIEELEADTLPFMERLEQYTNEVNDLETQIAELKPTIDELLDQENQRVATIDQKINSLQEKRQQLAQGVDNPLLKQYDQVRRSKRGVGLAIIVNNQRCGGCNVKLPIHAIQKAKKSGSLTKCPSCGRILWAKS